MLSLSSWVFGPRKCQCSSFLYSNNWSEVVCMSHSSDLVPCISFTLSHKNPYTIGFLDLCRFNCSHTMLLLYFSNWWLVYLTLSYQHDVVLSWGTSPSVCVCSMVSAVAIFLRDGIEAMASFRGCWQGKKALELCPWREKTILERNFFHYLDFLTFFNICIVCVDLPDLKNFTKSKSRS